MRLYARCMQDDGVPQSMVEVRDGMEEHTAAAMVIISQDSSLGLTLTLMVHGLYPPIHIPIYGLSLGLTLTLMVNVFIQARDTVWPGLHGIYPPSLSG